MRIFSYIAAIACAIAPIFALPATDVEAKPVSNMSDTTSNPYTIKIYYDHRATGHVLAVSDEEKQHSIIEDFLHDGVKVKGDWYLSPSFDYMKFAMLSTKLLGGVVYRDDLSIHSHFPLNKTPFVVLTNVNGHPPKRLYAFKQQAQRDAFHQYIIQKLNFTSDVDWAVAPGFSDTRAMAYFNAELRGVASMFTLSLTII